MQRSSKAGNSHFPSSLRVRGVALALGMTAFLVAAGCSNTGSAVKSKGDPLFGDPAIMPKGVGVPAVPTSFGKPAPPAVRPTGTTTASLVNNTEIPGLQGAKPLAIDSGWQRDLATPGGTSGPKVMPVPLDKSAAPTGLVTAGGWTAKDAPVAPLGGDPLARLQSLGALGIQQKAVPGGVHLSCFVPSPASPGSTRLVDVTAPTLAAAVDAIIQQIPR